MKNPERASEVLPMNGYAIIKIEADAIAAKEDIVPQFNAYMQQTAHAPSFVHEKEGYFRLSCNGEDGVSSAGVLELGKFLQSSGYLVTAIHNVSAGEGGLSTEMKFEKNGQEGSVTLSTVRIY